MLQPRTLALALLAATPLFGCASHCAPHASPAMLQPAARNVAPPTPPAQLPDVTPELIKESLAKGVEVLLSMQEGDNRDQWPYEGVYREKGEIPIGYRVGGTAIVVMALARSPGYAEDAPRQEAVARALAFICGSRSHPGMSIDDYAAGYDVRAWGYIEALQCLCLFQRLGLAPEASKQECADALDWYLAALQRIEIPRVGGWNYARPPGAENPGAPSTFMTGPALEALFAAAAIGKPVDAHVIQRGLAVLEKSRLATGSVVYSGEAGARDLDRTSNATPGAVGRMNCVESVLSRAGQSSPERVRAAVDAFLVHWGWLDQRRAKNGTHVAPYNVAPYYFMFAHLYAAQSVELLPRGERAEYRRRVLQMLFVTRAEDGTWNDRVFKRSAAFGTAVAMLAMTEPQAEHSVWAAQHSPAPAP